MTGHFRIDASLAGKRLDAGLARFLPDLGLRARRRLVASGNVSLNGQPAAASRKLKSGDLLGIVLPEQPGTAEARAQDDGQAPGLLASQGDYLFFYKPRGLHSAALAGGSHPSLEGLGASLAPDANGAAPRLLQRLDYNTSGIICAARNESAGQFFRKSESSGKCLKFYLALLRGELTAPEIARQALDCARRKKSRILKQDAPRLLWTRFEPLLTFPARQILPEAPDTAATIVLCSIHRGQRHQIRAHAAAIGYPLIGDPLYGDSQEENFRLEHFRLDFPGHSFTFFADDSLLKRLPETKRRMLEGNRYSLVEI